MNIDTAILQGIRTAVARRLRKYGHKVTVGNDQVWNTIIGDVETKCRHLIIDNHCSFVISGSKLVKNCEAGLTIDLANPNYLDYIEKAVVFCDHHYQWCNCSEIIDEWHEAIRNLK